MDAIDKQKLEFDSLTELAKQWGRLKLTAPVDDDYSEVRSDYESALSDFIAALRGNGRIAAGLGDYADFSTVNAKRALKWHPKGLDSWSLSDWCCAIAGEVGELCNVAKKLNRVRDGIVGNRETPQQLRDQVKDEAADVFIYLDVLSHAFGFSLWEAVRSKFNEVSARNGFEERI